MDTAVSGLTGQESLRFISAGAFLLLCGVQDYRTKKISLTFLRTAGCIVLTADVLACLAGTAHKMSFAAGMLPGFFLLLLSFAADGAAGKGDGISFMILGALAGVGDTLVILMVSLLLASVCGLVLMAVGKAGRKTKLPFLSFAAAAWAVVCALRLLYSVYA